MEREAKQVIVMRKDLNMRKGKMVAQGSHASTGVILDIQHDVIKVADLTAYNQWVNGQFSKICVSVDSEQELMEIYGKALQAKLPVKLITDSGRTEFHGVATRTCLAIGPAWSEDIDRITGGLKLL